ncbi:MAG: RAMP superfamily CRISPR-associated protein [Acidobacteriota bacterium]
MKYRVTCLTPTLVGDGNKLAPIDYMVWKDHINVLDQRRIFKLLSRGPRLEGYLAQLKKADKLDFASWGGFAQNFAGRRIPFEHESAVPVWERTPAQNLFIPTFAVSTEGSPYLPATAIKGALRTGAVFDRWSAASMRDLANRISADEAEGKRAPRNPASKAEDAVLGGAGKSLMRRVAAGDSGSITYSDMKVYLLRTSTLVAKGGGVFELGWKSSRGTSDARRIDDATPTFAEMAAPGVTFEGTWREGTERDREKLFQASNRFAAAQLAHHKQYAQWTGLAPLAATLDGLEARVKAASSRPDACVLSIGWGGGVLSKVAAGDTSDEGYRSIAKRISLYQNALRTGLPFPKTRRVVFQAGKAAQLPGWILLEIV